MDPERIVREACEMYRTSISPLIAEGNYGLAYLRFADDMLLLEINRDSITRRVHTGAGFVAATVRLCDQLYEASEDRPNTLESAQRGFEAFAAQTRLPSE